MFELRPFTYSFSNVMTIKDVQRLMAATILRQMAHTMTYILDIKGGEPVSPKTYNYFTVGAALSYIFIALMSDCIYGKKRKFYPLYCCLLVLISYQVALAIASCFWEVRDNVY